MGEIVIVAYRPKPGQDDALLALARTHVPMLRRLGLATARAPIVTRGSDGVLVEVFEWANGAAARAHENAEVLAMWERYGAVCDYVPLKELPEAGAIFATFAPVDIG